LDGVISLRAAFTSNIALMRVFLNATDLNSEGAICLAEYLPELKTVIHLDLTENFEIDIAGVMALSVAVRMNKSLRCLDLNIPANDPDFSRLSQDILQSCIRNTEMAQEALLAKGSTQSIPTPMLKSTVARNLEERKQKIAAMRERRNDHIGEIVSAATECRDLLGEVYASAEGESAKAQDELYKDVLSQARAAQMQLAEAVKLSAESDLRTNAESLDTELLHLCNSATALLEGKPLPPDSSAFLQPSPLSPSVVPPHSPSFSITDSDDEDSDDGQRTDTKLSLDIPSDTRLIPQPLNTSPSSSPSESLRSPIESASKFMTLEEGEVFRKKTILDAENEDESEDDQEDVSGEVLRQEILTADVPQRTTNQVSPQLQQQGQIETSEDAN